MPPVPPHFGAGGADDAGAQRVVGPERKEQAPFAGLRAFRDDSTRKERRDFLRGREAVVPGEYFSFPGQAPEQSKVCCRVRQQGEGPCHTCLHRSAAVDCFRRFAVRRPRSEAWRPFILSIARRARSLWLAFAGYMTRSRRFGPVVLAEGYSPLNAIGVLLGGFSIIPLLAFMGLIMPFSSQGGFSRSTPHFHGRMTGTIWQCLQEVDRDHADGGGSDRRPTISAGACSWSMGLVPCGPGASGLPACRKRDCRFTDIGPYLRSAPRWLPSCTGPAMQDTPTNRSRGQFIGFGSLATGGGVIVMGLTIARLPAIPGRARRRLPKNAGIYTCWCMVAFAAIVADDGTPDLARGPRGGGGATQTCLAKPGDRDSPSAVRNPRIALSHT